MENHGTKKLLTTANPSGRVGIGARNSLLKADNAPDRLRFFVPAICNIAGVRRIQNPQGEEVRLTFGRFLTPATMRSIESPFGSVVSTRTERTFYDYATFTTSQISRKISHQRTDAFNGTRYNNRHGQGGNRLCRTRHCSQFARLFCRAKQETIRIINQLTIFSTF